MAQELLFLRDLAEVEPPRDRYKLYDDEDIYRHVPRPQWTGLDDEIWTPRNQESDPQLEKVKALIKKQSNEDVGVADASITGEDNPDNRGRHAPHSLTPPGEAHPINRSKKVAHAVLRPVRPRLGFPPVPVGLVWCEVCMLNARGGVGQRVRGRGPWRA